MNNNATLAAIIALGLIGLYFKVEYSGWVLFVGLMGAAL